MATKVPFKVVRGAEASILNYSDNFNGIYPDGTVYFATDTRKIYYGDGTSQLTPMGGNSGVWYGQMHYAETPEESQVDFDFQIDDIEGNSDISYSVPNENDLIFNIPDGSFYRVLEIDGSGADSILHCRRLTVAGSGGGGQGGGGTNVGVLTVSRLGSQNINVLRGQECKIRFSFSAVDASGEATGDGIYILQVRGSTKETGKVIQGENSIDVSKYLELGSNAISVIVEGDVGTTTPAQAKKNWQVTVTNLALTWNYDDTTINTEDNFTFTWNITTSLAHTAYIDIDSLYLIEIPYEAGTSRDKTYTISRDEWGLTHGAHEVQLYVKLDIDGTAHESDHVSHMVICVDNDRSDTIISIPTMPLKINQYDTLSIPIILYDPTSVASDNKVSATLRENGIDKDNWVNYNNGQLYYWNYTAIEPGEKVLSILSGTAERTIRLAVNDLGLTVQEVSGYEFKFKASDIISNNNLQNWTFNDVAISFSNNFDWTNGGLKSELNDDGNIQNCVTIKAGDRMSFNYNPFKSIDKSKGFSIKIIFKAFNCRQYDASVLSIGSKANNDLVYLELKGNGAIYQPQGDKPLTVPYCEDSYIEFEIDVDTTSNPYIMTWLDGVPSSAQTYDPDLVQFANRNIENIIIGSDDCDVNVYMIKVYQKHLTNEQHLDNFIMDAPNSTEIVSRYNRNNILDDNGEISYQKLIEKNPNCDVYLYEIPRMTKTKKDKVDGCTYQRFKGKITPEQTAENVTMAVQGTSSARYGLAAFNFNSTFNDGFTDYSNSNEGEHIDDWAMSENAIPIHDFNTKVNVASCEGANNALNQEWYNKFVPYVTEYQIKNPKSRHTMEFMNMGVVFIKDNNPNFNAENGVDNNVFNDTEGYVYNPEGGKNGNPYYKLYSICNMGNIKRNDGVFSDLDNPYDVIMENPDNQSVYQQMTGNVDENGKLIGVWEGDKFYPLLLENSYFETEDSKAEAHKTYYQRTGEEGNYVYTAVEGLVIGSSSVEGLYELYTAGQKAPTEVFEWRTVPAHTWDALKAEHPDDPAYDFHKQGEDAWTDLVAWFAVNNPNAATGETIPAETYEPYTFKGYTSKANRIDKNGEIMPTYTPSVQVLKGLSISQYAGTYTKDTYERRMAKMLSECEDHLIMDEIVFHYLFIERHTLIDNVAKNTFWHTEDLQHWSMIKDYDNDTSDGNDNSGHLTLTYGYEVLDHMNHDPNQSFVFNAAASVWLHFIDNLLEARTLMYQYLDRSEIGAWDSKPYLDKFNEWQSSLPERVWIEDYYRKYIRPKEVYGATQFLPMLEGGKKTHQRKQFETYQEAYMSSEYNGLLCQSSAIDIRANGSGIDAMEFPMTMYADCYIRVAAGSGNDPNVRYRYRRGDIAKIKLPVTGDANDMTTYFFLANYITSIGNMEMLKPKKVDISAASRLREFSMKRIAESVFYIETQDSEIASDKQYYKQKFTEVDVPDENELINYYELIGNKYQKTTDESIVIGKIYYIFDGYEAVSAPIISELDQYYEQVISSQNLNLTEARFENNRMLEKLEVMDCPRAENALNLRNATNLKYLDITGSSFRGLLLASDAPVETLNLNAPEVLSFTNLFKVNTFNISYNNLNSLYLDNIDNTDALNSKMLVDNYQGSSLRYNLQNVNWVIDNSNEISDDEINILEKLLDERNTPGDAEKNIEAKYALSGNLLITENAYNGDHSLDLYNKYIINHYPNLNIIFEGDNAQLYDISIADGNNNIVWTKKAKSEYNITSEFLASGPDGAFNVAQTTHKENTASQTFSFSGKWLIKNADTNEDIAIIDRSEESDKSPYYNEALSANIIIIPEFVSNIRTYELTINVNGTEQVLAAVQYGTSLVVKAEELYPNGPSISDETLPFDQTYNFEGWSLRPNSENIISNIITLQDDTTLYAVFKIKNVHSNIHPEWFRYGVLDENLKTAVLFPQADVTLQGKVTIPNTLNGYVITEIGEFATYSSTGITHIFFEDAATSQIVKIRNGCFRRISTLTYFEYPAKLEVIGTEAFAQTHLQVDLIENDMNLYEIGNSHLKEIWPSAFQNALYSNRSYNVKIPSSVELIGWAAFGWENNFAGTIILGTPADLSQWDAYYNPNYNNTKANGGRFSQNDRPITLSFFSAKYQTLNDVIAQRTENDEADFTILRAIHNESSYLTLETNLT